MTPCESYHRDDILDGMTDVGIILTLARASSQHLSGSLADFNGGPVREYYECNDAFIRWLRRFPRQEITGQEILDHINNNSDNKDPLAAEWGRAFLHLYNIYDTSATNMQQPRNAGRLESIRRGEPYSCLSVNLHASAFNESGTKFVAFPNPKRNVACYTTRPGVRLFECEQATVNAFAFSPDGRLLAAGGDEELVVYDANKGTQLRNRGVQSVAVCIDFVPENGRIAFGSSNGRIWTLDNESLEVVHAVRFGEVRQYVAIAENDLYGNLSSSISVFDTFLWLEIFREIITHVSHNPFVNQLAFSPNNRTLAAGIGEEGVRLMDMDPEPKKSERLFRTQHVNFLAFDVEGKHLSAGGKNGKCESIPIPAGW